MVTINSRNLFFEKNYLNFVIKINFYFIYYHIIKINLNSKNCPFVKVKALFLNFIIQIIFESNYDLFHIL